MIEAIIGFLIVMGAATLAAGLADGVLPVPPAGLGTTLAIAAAGFLLIAHALFRARRDRNTGDTYWLRTAGLTWAAVLTAGAVGLLAPLVFAPMGLIKAAGFPLSYYMAAQGLPILLVAELFAYCRKQDAIDREHRDAGS